jgi:Reverse transcriptase (RNA-dependent DNA polymerase)
MDYASRQGHGTINSKRLLHIGFKPSASDPSLFLFKQGHDIAFLLVYVDDIILIGNNSSIIHGVVQLLDQKFTIKNLSKLHFFLGIEVHNTDLGLQLTQSKYIYTILDKAKMQGAKPNSRPMATGKPLSKLDGVAFEDPHVYRSVVGALQYVAISRPDISFVINHVS